MTSSHTTTRLKLTKQTPSQVSAIAASQRVVSDEAIGAVHRLLVALPAPARAELAEALPAPVQPLMGMAADLDAEDFKQACSLPPSLPPTPSPLAVPRCC